MGRYGSFKESKSVSQLQHLEKNQVPVSEVCKGNITRSLLSLDSFAESIGIFLSYYYMPMAERYLIGYYIAKNDNKFL